MPLPTPSNKQTQKEWISSCMSNKTMKKEYPTQDQRLAICYSIWRNKNKKNQLECLSKTLDNILDLLNKCK